MPTRSAVILVGLLLLARPVGAQVATPRDSLKELGPIGVDIRLTRNPSAERRGLTNEFVRTAVKSHVEQLNVSTPDENEPEVPYLLILINTARVGDRFVVRVDLQLFQLATLANGETVEASTWRSSALEIIEADRVPGDVRNLLQAHMGAFTTDYLDANE